MTSTTGTLVWRIRMACERTRKRIERLSMQLELLAHARNLPAYAKTYARWSKALRYHRMMKDSLHPHTLEHP